MLAKYAIDKDFKISTLIISRYGILKYPWRDYTHTPYSKKIKNL